MATPIKKYIFDKNRLLRSCMDGFAVAPGGALAATAGERHIAFFGRLDSNKPGCEWGRLRFELEGEAVPVIRAFASDDSEFINGGEITSFNSFLLDREIPAQTKLNLFEQAGGSRHTGKCDLLLYGQNGRYLWLCMELVGDLPCAVKNLTVYAPRDNFYATLPEIYRSDDDFLHRYMSIFSSLYYDLQETIDNLASCADVDTAPKEALPILASWLGLELDGGFLSEQNLRNLLKAAFALYEVKGTRSAVESLVGIFVDEPFYIVEQRAVVEGMSGGERAVRERLYGRSPFDYTVMLCRPPDEKLHARLKLLLGQFTMLRCRANIIFLEQGCRTDSHSYLDINARVLEASRACLDTGDLTGDLVSLG